MSYTVIEDVEIQQVPDEDGDPSHLDSTDDDGRLTAYDRGEWGYVGIRAMATLYVTRGRDRISHEVKSPGLWGIESDSSEDYLKEVAQDELTVLRDMLVKLGVTAAATDLRFGPIEETQPVTLDPRTFDYVESRLLAPDRLDEVTTRLRAAGHGDLAEEVMNAAQVFMDSCRAVRRKIRRTY